MAELFVYWLKTDDGRNAVAVAHDHVGAITHAQIYDPTGGWDKARLECLGPTFPSMFNGVVALERRDQ